MIKNTCNLRLSIAGMMPWSTKALKCQSRVSHPWRCASQHLPVAYCPILPLPNSSAACCSWCRRLQQEPPRHQADTQYLTCPCWYSDLVVAACATYSAGNAQPEPRGCSCWCRCRPACPCWCRDLVVAACAAYSAGNVPPEPRGGCCKCCCCPA